MIAAEHRAILFAIASDTHSHYLGRRLFKEGLMGRKAGLWCALMSGIWMAGGAPAFAADTAAVIEHEGNLYRLRRTSRGGLVLTK